MKKNVGAFDKIVRIVLAVVFAALILTGTVSGGLAWILGLLGFVFLLTSAVSFCPLYAALKLTTHKASVAPSK